MEVVSTASQCWRGAHVGVGHSSQDSKYIYFPGAHLFTCSSGSGRQSVAGWTAKVAWEAVVCSTCSQDDTTGLLASVSSPSLPHCLGSPPTPPTAAGELVRDKYQGLVGCQSHRENTAGSTSFVAELVVYRLFPASNLGVYPHVYTCFCAGAWA